MSTAVVLYPDYLQEEATASVLSASTEDTDMPKESVLDLRQDIFWAPTATPATIVASFGTNKYFSAVGLYGVGVAGATCKLEYVFSGTWYDVDATWGEFTWDEDGPLLATFEEVRGFSVRLTIGNEVSAPQVSIIAAGDALELPSGVANETLRPRWTVGARTQIQRNRQGVAIGTASDGYFGESRYALRGIDASWFLGDGYDWWRHAMAMGAFWFCPDDNEPYDSMLCRDAVLTFQKERGDTDRLLLEIETSVVRP